MLYPGLLWWNKGSALELGLGFILKVEDAAPKEPPNKQLWFLKGERKWVEKNACTCCVSHTMLCPCLGLVFQLVGGSLARGTLLVWWFGV